MTAAEAPAGHDGGFQVVVMVKYPTPGTVKTRLAGRLGPAVAAELAVAFLRDLAARLEASGIVPLWAVWPPAAPLEEVLRGARCVAQVGADLGERMAGIAERVLRERPVVLLGADAPHVDVAGVRAAGAMLVRGEAEVVLGPAEDGGYYLLGLRRFVAEVFRDIEWGGSSVCADTQTRLAALGIRHRLLELTFDVDEAADLDRLVALLRAGSIELPHTSVVLARAGFR